MPWDKDFAWDAVDDEAPAELLAKVEQVLADEDSRLESVTLARKRRESRTGKPSASYIKWATYIVEPAETAEEICAVLIGGAYACADADGDLSVNKFEVTIVWSSTDTGRKDRDRCRFELDEGRRKQHRQHASPSCPGCVAYRDAAELFRCQVASLQRDLVTERKRTEELVAGERYRLEESLKAERDARDRLAQQLMDARDKLVGELTKLSKEFAQVGADAAKDARECYRPTEAATAQILGMLGGAIDAYKGAIEAQAEHAQQLVESQKSKQRSELAKQSLSMVEKLAMKVISAKFGKGTDKESDDDKKATAMDKLKQTRDELFARALPGDWEVLEQHAGADFVAKVQAMREGEIDLVALDEACERLAKEKSPKDLMTMLFALSEPVQDIMMSIGDLVRAARTEAGV